MIDRESIKLKITDCIEIRKYLTTYFIILTAGVVSLTLTDFAAYSTILIIIGTVIDVIIFLGISSQCNNIKELIRIMEEGE